jgi:hypothetical protein
MQPVFMKACHLAHMTGCKHDYMTSHMRPSDNGVIWSRFREVHEDGEREVLEIRDIMVGGMTPVPKLIHLEVGGFRK